MRKWLNWIGLGLMAAAAGSMIAADAFAGEPSQGWEPTAQKFYLEFTTLAPTDISCDATGPGVRTKLTRNLAGKPILRVTGNAAAAQITCWRKDGTRYTTDVNQRVLYNTAAPVRALVSFDRQKDAMTVLVQRGENDRLAPTVMPRAFVKVAG